jgi:hypothetical protein
MLVRGSLQGRFLEDVLRRGPVLSRKDNDGGWRGPRYLEVISKAEILVAQDAPILDGCVEGLTPRGLLSPLLSGNAEHAESRAFHMFASQYCERTQG